MKTLRKILIIEDNDEVSEMLKVGLEMKLGPGTDVRIATDLSQARKVLRDFEPDLVFSDNDLPDGKGPELFGELKALPNPPYICHMSGHVIPQGPNADIFVYKPTLHEMINGIILHAKYKA